MNPRSPLRRVSFLATTAPITRVAIGLHWTTAALVLVQFTLSQLWGLFARPYRHLLVAARMSFVNSARAGDRRQNVLATLSGTVAPNSRGRAFDAPDVTAI